MIRKYIDRSAAVLVAGMLIFACGCGAGRAEESGKEGDAVWTEEVSDSRSEERGEGSDGGSEEGGEISDIGKEESADEKEAGGSTENGAEQKNTIVWDDTEGEGIKTIHGNVKSHEDGKFTIIQAMTGTIEGGKGDIIVIGVSGEEDDNLITVEYSSKTEFVVQTTTDGMTSTEREGSREELKEDSSVIITGSWEGEIFHADKIVIFIVDM